MTESLSFTRRRDDGKLILWAPERPEGHDDGTTLGASYAREMVAVMRETRDPTLLGDVFNWMLAGGKYDSVEVGFCHELGVVLVGLQHQRRVGAFG